MKSDVCLISPLTRSYNHYRPPLDLMYISSYLEQKGIKTTIIDEFSANQISDQKSPFEKFQVRKKILARINSSKAGFIGISCYTSEYNEVICLAKMIKNEFPEKVIIVGGIHATLYPQDFCYKNSPIDYVVVGEGEATMTDLVKTLKQKTKPKNQIKGIMFFDKKSHKVITTKPRCLIQNLDELPFPDYKKINMEYYTTPNPYAIRGIFLSSFYILTSRGCPSRCTFCVSKKLRESYRKQQYIRCRTPKNILKEVIFLKEKYKIDSFYIVDDFFAINQKNTQEFCRLLIKYKINLLWGCSTKITALSETTIDLMKKSGCIQIDFGVESGFPKILKQIKKDITLANIKNAFKICRKYSIRTFANILINLPKETKKDVGCTLKLLDEFKPTIVSFNIFTPYLGTEIYDNLKIKLDKKEYFLLGECPLKLIKKKPKLFRFSNHNLNLSRFVRKNHQKYNSTLEALKIHLSFFYLNHITRSKQKLRYLVNICNLLKEYLKQKFSLVLN